ncbi:bacteriocin-like protein [Chryseobacterium sp. T16E-39]|uniref:bacteriocin-like protein n=1 Tax=Chryseobacterium sp. T16E-39 TaxID=2015076 RepID=UPI0012FA2399|nr:hypothetical protein [Chryseobacterium sp. T16E-39]
MKNLKKVTRQNLKKVTGGVHAQCCTYYPPSLQAKCCTNSQDMNCPPAWVEGSFPEAC